MKSNLQENKSMKEVILNQYGGNPRWIKTVVFHEPLMNHFTLNLKMKTPGLKEHTVKSFVITKGELKHLLEEVEYEKE